MSCHVSAVEKKLGLTWLTDIWHVAPLLTVLCCFASLPPQLSAFFFNLFFVDLVRTMQCDAMRMRAMLCRGRGWGWICSVGCSVRREIWFGLFERRGVKGGGPWNQAREGNSVLGWIACILGFVGSVGFSVSCLVGCFCFWFRLVSCFEMRIECRFAVSLLDSWLGLACGWPVLWFHYSYIIFVHVHMIFGYIFILFIHM